MAEKIRVYIAGNCGPCEDIRKMVQEGKAPEGVELVDIETDEGFAEFTAEVLTHGDGGVPSAYKGGQLCEIFKDDQNNTLIIDCPEPPPSSPSS